MSSESVAERRAEFELHVWNHSVDPFQMEFDVRRPLDRQEMSALSGVIDALHQDNAQAAAVKRLHGCLTGKPALVHLFLQLAGLTRNKIISDLRAALSGRETVIPSTPEKLHLNAGAWALAGPYLVKRLTRVLTPLLKLGAGQEFALEALNQATWPGWIRQERAKRQGHEAESRLAGVLAAVGIPFEPVDKAENPMCRDIQIQRVSFDLVIPSALAPLVVLKSTVHTSNIGQYGESKDALEMAEAAAMIQKHFPKDERPTLLALIDGVGFRSNRAGLDGVLKTADEFCQFKTLWKGAVIAAARLGRKITVNLSDPEARHHKKFLERYARHLHLKVQKHELRERCPAAVDAGEATILL